MSYPPDRRAIQWKLEAFTDWLAIVCITFLVSTDHMPWEWGAGLIAGIAGVTGIAKGIGKPGGSISLVGVAGWKAVAAFLSSGKLS